MTAIVSSVLHTPLVADDGFTYRRGYNRYRDGGAAAAAAVGASGGQPHSAAITTTTTVLTPVHASVAAANPVAMGDMSNAPAAAAAQHQHPFQGARLIKDPNAGYGARNGGAATASQPQAQPSNIHSMTTYRPCRRFAASGTCHFGARCTYSHAAHFHPNYNNEQQANTNVAPAAHHQAHRGSGASASFSSPTSAARPPSYEDFNNMMQTSGSATPISSPTNKSSPSMSLAESPQRYRHDPYSIAGFFYYESSNEGSSRASNVGTE